mmetsp:Transcript_116512/g.213468  ORF Transcript_116512/g.213468 Transcript_116512/m.213468 type:complete len:118 (+) Transcript_116512:146-499(+)
MATHLLPMAEHDQAHISKLQRHTSSQKASRNTRRPQATGDTKIIPTEDAKIDLSSSHERGANNRRTPRPNAMMAPPAMQQHVICNVSALGLQNGTRKHSERQQKMMGKDTAIGTMSG